MLLTLILIAGFLGFFVIVSYESLTWQSMLAMALIIVIAIPLLGIVESLRKRFFPINSTQGITAKTPTPEPAEAAVIPAGEGKRDI
jgi:hypothetical protein